MGPCGAHHAPKTSFSDQVRCSTSCFSLASFRLLGPKCPQGSEYKKLITNWNTHKVAGLEFFNLRSSDGKGHHRLLNRYLEIWSGFIWINLFRPIGAHGMITSKIQVRTPSFWFLTEGMQLRQSWAGYLLLVFMLKVVTQERRGGFPLAILLGLVFGVLARIRFMTFVSNPIRLREMR